MDKITAAAFILTVAVVVVFLGALMGSLGGAFAGWLFGHVFVDTSAKLQLATGFQPYQMGAIIGFVGGFFRSTRTNNQKAS